MKERIIKVLVVALAVGIFMVSSPLVGQAVTITSVLVDFGGTGNTWCDTISVCANPIWNLAGGVNLGTGGSALILTQTAASPFNFDSSDFNLGAATITINGTVFNDNGQILNDHGLNANNEAADWTLPTINTLNGIKLWVAYADNSHSQPCADADGNCLPENPWLGSPNTTFLGGTTTSATGCLRPGTTSCFDAGAIRIEGVPTAAPEPSILSLLGVGLVGIAVYNRKRTRTARNNT